MTAACWEVRVLVIKITGEENVVCDCKGDTVGKYVDRLTVAIIKTTDGIVSFTLFL